MIAWAVLVGSLAVVGSGVYRKSRWWLEDRRIADDLARLVGIERVSWLEPNESLLERASMKELIETQSKAIRVAMEEEIRRGLEGCPRCEAMTLVVPAEAFLCKGGVDARYGPCGRDTAGARVRRRCGVKPWQETWEARGHYLTWPGALGVYELRDSNARVVVQDIGRTKLIVAAPEMARVLLRLEWGIPSHWEGRQKQGTCPECMGRQWIDGGQREHHNSCTLDAALVKAGFPDQASRDEARKGLR